MGVDWLTDKDKNQALLYCNTLDCGFGPLIDPIKGKSIDETVWGFLKWLPRDARLYIESELGDLLNEYAAENGGFEFENKNDPNRPRLYIRKFPLHKVIFWVLCFLACGYVCWVAAMIFIEWNWPA